MFYEVSQMMLAVMKPETSQIVRQYVQILRNHKPGLGLSEMTTVEQLRQLRYLLPDQTQRQKEGQGGVATRPEEVLSEMSQSTFKICISRRSCIYPTSSISLVDNADQSVLIEHTQGSWERRAREINDFDVGHRCILRTRSVDRLVFANVSEKSDSTFEICHKQRSRRYSTSSMPLVGADKSVVREHPQGNVEPEERKMDDFGHRLILRARQVGRLADADISEVSNSTFKICISSKSCRYSTSSISLVDADQSVAREYSQGSGESGARKIYYQSGQCCDIREIQMDELDKYVLGQRKNPKILDSMSECQERQICNRDL